MGRADAHEEYACNVDRELGCFEMIQACDFGIGWRPLMFWCPCERWQCLQPLGALQKTVSFEHTMALPY